MAWLQHLVNILFFYWWSCRTRTHDITASSTRRSANGPLQILQYGYQVRSRATTKCSIAQSDGEPGAVQAKLPLSIQSAVAAPPCRQSWPAALGSSRVQRWRLLAVLSDESQPRMARSCGDWRGRQFCRPMHGGIGIGIFGEDALLECSVVTPTVCRRRNGGILSDSICKAWRLSRAMESWSRLLVLHAVASRVYSAVPFLPGDTQSLAGAGPTTCGISPSQRTLPTAAVLELSIRDDHRLLIRSTC